VISFKDLIIGYSHPLAHVQLHDLQVGNVYALIGSNGSGKSTFMKTLSGQISPIYGNYYINGKTNKELTRMERAKTIAFVPTIFPISDFMSAQQFVTLGRTPYLKYLAQLSLSDKQIIDQTFHILQISHLKEKYTQELSDGQRQLCSLARAIVQQTPIIFLDEPTNFLDYRNKHKIISLLIEIARNQKKCILFSSHDIETIFAYNDIKLLGINNKQSSKFIEFIDKKKPFEQLIDNYYSTSVRK